MQAKNIHICIGEKSKTSNVLHSGVGLDNIQLLITHQRAESHFIWRLSLSFQIPMLRLVLLRPQPYFNL